MTWTVADDRRRPPFPRGRARDERQRNEDPMTNTKMVPMAMPATANAPLCVVIPLKTVNPLNSRRHFRAVARQAKIDKTTVLAHLMSVSGWRRDPAGEWVVTLTRLSAGTLDAHDNLRAALKHVVDSTALFLGLDDASPRITWQYDQKPVSRGEYGVMVRIEARPQMTCNRAIQMATRQDKVIVGDDLPTAFTFRQGRRR